MSIVLKWRSPALQSVILSSCTVPPHSLQGALPSRLELSKETQEKYLDTLGFLSLLDAVVVFDAVLEK